MRRRIDSRRIFVHSFVYYDAKTFLDTSLSCLNLDNDKWRRSEKRQGFSYLRIKKACRFSVLIIVDSFDLSIRNFIDERTNAGEEKEKSRLFSFFFDHLKIDHVRWKWNLVKKLFTSCEFILEENISKQHIIIIFIDPFFCLCNYISYWSSGKSICYCDDHKTSSNSNINQSIFT